MEHIRLTVADSILCLFNGHNKSDIPIATAVAREIYDSYIHHKQQQRNARFLPSILLRQQPTRSAGVSLQQKRLGKF